MSKKVNLPNIKNPGAGSGRAGTERGAVADGISSTKLDETHGHFLRNTNFLGCSSKSMEKVHVGTTEFDHKLAGMAEAVCLMKVVAD